MDAIIQEFILYIENYIEKPNKIFKNLPVCPFAKKFKSKVKFLVIDLDLEKIRELISVFDYNYIIYTIIHSSKEFDINLLKSVTSQLEKDHPLFEIFYGHPNDDFNINGEFTRRDPYPNIQIVVKSEIEKFRKKLENTQYYSDIVLPYLK